MFWIPPRKQNPYDPVFANNTWAKIIKACQNKEVPETWTVGSQKAMTINGTAYVIDIIGKGHDDYADGSGKAPLTFQLHDCYDDLYAMNDTSTNVGGWTSCAMRQTHLPTILSKMPTEVQNGIREVNKRTSAGNLSATINITADKLFLLSEIEIFGSRTYSEPSEGSQYAYYKAGNSKVKNDLYGDPNNSWERSPANSKAGDESLYFCMVLADGEGEAEYNDADSPEGVPFAFCF